MSALHRERWFPAWLVLPGSLTLMLLWLLPLAVLVQLTLGVSSGTLGRFWHMVAVLAHDPVVQQGLLAQTLRMTLMVALEAVLGLLLARMLPLRGWAAGWWCTLLGVMLFTPLIISVMGWKVLFLPPLALPAWCVPGLAECVPGALPPLARSSIMLLRDLWQWTPLFALLCLARLRHIQRVQYQSVLFDGGSGWAAFRLLEWPWLRGALALGVFYRLMVGAFIDVDFFRHLAGAGDGALARLAESQDWFGGVSSSVPGAAPMSWLLPGLMSFTDRLSDISIHDLTTCLTLLQAMLVLPMMLTILWLIGRGRSRLSIGGTQQADENLELGRRRGFLRGVCRWLVLGAFVVFAILPLLWLARLALQGATPEEGIGFTHFMAVIDDPVWRTSLLRTGLRALLTAAAAVVLAVPMAYAWSRRLLAGERLMAVTMLVSLMMPAVVLAFPLIHLNELLGWLGMPYAVGLAHLSFAVPLAVWILAAGMAQVPVALDEMAMQDGFGFTHFIVRVLLPAIHQQVRGAFLACFLVGWMEFLFARVLGSVVWPPSVVMLSESVAALPAVQAGMPRLEWQVLAAAAWLVLLPVVLAVYALRDQLPDMLSLFRLPSMRVRGRRSRGTLESV